jgi:NADH-quinone oxidoreductase subunit H
MFKWIRKVFSFLYFIYLVIFFIFPLYGVSFLLFLSLFLKFICLFILFTLLIATLTLIERKVLALIQRRVGPNYTGYRGRLQFISDAVKFIIKHIQVLNLVNRFVYIILPIIILFVSFLFWVNIVWGPNMAICEIEYNLFFLCIISGLFSILILVAGFLSNNKYAILAASRAILISLNLEILFGFYIVVLAFISNFTSFASLVV